MAGGRWLVAGASRGVVGLGWKPTSLRSGKMTVCLRKPGLIDIKRAGDSLLFLWGLRDGRGETTTEGTEDMEKRFPGVAVVGKRDCSWPAVRGNRLNLANS